MADFMRGALTSLWTPSRAAIALSLCIPSLVHRDTGVFSRTSDKTSTPCNKAAEKQPEVVIFNEGGVPLFILLCFLFFLGSKLCTTSSVTVIHEEGILTRKVVCRACVSCSRRAIDWPGGRSCIRLQKLHIHVITQWQTKMV